METQKQKPKRRGLRIVVGVVVALAILTGVYHGALAYYAPDPEKLGAWRGDLESAVAEARATGKLLVIKAGSLY